MSVERHRIKGTLPSFMLGLSTFPGCGGSTGPDAAWSYPLLDRLQHLAG